VLCGFLSLDDPIRDEVPEAVARCHTAGIRVLMITGDHPDTAESVARTCGILPPGAPAEGRVLYGEELERLREQQLVERLRDGVSVFARTTPEQKMKIVAALKRLGLVAAMTGDGVNDTPALRAADVGIAMGQGGTDVAREAADIVLLDDNFASIAAGIEEGRAVFANMQKFTTYVLSSNVPEIVPFVLYVLLPVPLGLTVIQILSIDLGTDMLPAIGLGQEPPEGDGMRRPPRRLDQRLLSPRLMVTAYLFLGLIQAVFSLSLFFLVLYQGGWHWGQELVEGDPLYRSATGITLAAVILMQIGNVIGRRSLRGSGLDRGLLRNRILLLGVATEILFSWAVLYAPPVQAFLQTGPVDWRIYAIASLGIPLIFALDYARKRLVGQWERQRAVGSP
jgi:sodium/potassium-transporting ATPase subunit alpha